MLELDVQGRIGCLNVSVTIPSVSTLLVIGPNGAGKSTILSMLLGLLRPETGRIVLNDRVLFDSQLRVDVPAEKREIGFLPQAYALFPNMRVLENVLFGLECRKPHLKKQEARRVAMAALSEVNVGHLCDRYPRELSGGEAQRVALARAIAPEPEALVLDEPTGALDLDSRSQVRRFLGSYLSAKGIPTVVVSHDPDDGAMLPGWIAVMERGCVAQQGPLHELVENPANRFASSFVCRTPMKLAAGS